MRRTPASAGTSACIASCAACRRPLWPTGSASRFQQLQKYEKGSNRIGSGRLARIAEILELPVAALFDGGAAGNGGAGASSVLALLSVKDRIRLVQAFASIEDRALRRSLVTLVERIAARFAD